ncbi:DUF2934 domain-containing protein [Oleisolibacter albus]|uniref:DUF2934 domain-containing protein n=1 Tax=Oleisolibacter albus TaxID=2171757 RepID=UPI0030841A3F
MRAVPGSSAPPARAGASIWRRLGGRAVALRDRRGRWNPGALAPLEGARITGQPRGNSMTDLDAQIRQRAYDIWQREGCPDGRQDEHWARAREEVLAEGEGGADTGAETVSTVSGDGPQTEGTEAAPARRGRSAASDQGSGEADPAGPRPRGRGRTGASRTPSGAVPAAEAPASGIEADAGSRQGPATRRVPARPEGKGEA